MDDPNFVDAFNAYSRNGTASGLPVYVNFGQIEDFEVLQCYLCLIHMQLQSGKCFSNIFISVLERQLWYRVHGRQDMHGTLWQDLQVLFNKEKMKSVVRLDLWRSSNDCKMMTEIRKTLHI